MNNTDTGISIFTGIMMIVVLVQLTHRFFFYKPNLKLGKSQKNFARFVIYPIFVIFFIVVEYAIMIRLYRIFES